MGWTRQETVVGLECVGRDDLEVVGGKAANLGELLRAGVQVPPGFVVTTKAYGEAFSAVSMSGAAAGAEPDQVRRLLESAPVAPQVGAAITEAYEAMAEGRVAVRSSATAEDMPGAAFAGQQDTFLNVSGAAEVVEAVRRCWASLWTERAVAYRDHRAVDHRQVQIAVVVQRMVDAEFAGVSFTADPVTGHRGRLVIDAAPGLGQAVVSGAVTPEHVVLDAHDRVLERRPGRRTAETKSAADRPPQEFTIGALDDAVLHDLAQASHAIAELFGRPQDIEWAYAEGAVWIVQARPLTALPPAPLKVGPIRRIYGSVLAELLPDRPYPLDMTTWTTRGHGRILTRMMAELPAVSVDVRQMLPEAHGVVQQLVPPRIRPSWRTLTTPVRMRPRIQRFHPQQWTSDPRFADFDRCIQELRAVDPATLTWAELLELPDRAFAALDRFIDLRIDYLPSVGVALIRLRAWLAVLAHNAAFGALIAGGPTRTADANRQLGELGELIKSNTVWAQVFKSHPVEVLVRRIEEDEVFGPLRAALRTYTDEFGHRETTSAFVMSAPTWGEDPQLLLGALKARVQHGATPSAARPAEETERRVLASRRVRWTRSGGRLAAAVRSARGGVAFREDTHFHAMRALPIVRRSMLEAGARLARAGVLEDPGDILHLRFDEITGIADPHTVDGSQIAALRSAVGQRMAARAELAGVPLISPATLYRTPAASTALVAGTPASGGHATGTVRLVLHPTQFGRLRAGEILVCPYTNPSWTPLFQLAAAVVVDTGGAASHAAIVAREYGIPAVMGTGNGTRLLQDGQRVSVDGTAGHVQVAETAS